MATFNFSIDAAGNITPTATQSASANDTVSVSANKFTVYVYDTSGTRTSDLFGTDTILYNQWPKTVQDYPATYILSTCANGLTCDAAAVAPQGSMHSKASVVSERILTTRSNGTINVGGTK